jgi:iron(III) transport system permease protein
MGIAKRILSLRLLRPESPLFVIALVVAALITILAALIIWSTFQQGIPGFKAEFTLENYREVLFASFTGQAAINTILLGLGTVLVSCFFAIPIGWLIHRTNVPLKRFFLTLMFLHVLLPGFLRTMGWIMMASPKIGILNQILREVIPVESGPLSIYNIPSMCLIQGLSLAPTLFFMVAGAFVAIDPAFEESAQISGANLFNRLRRIALPLVMPAVVAGSIYIFMTGVSMFEVPALLGMPSNIWVFSTVMFDAAHPEVGLPNYGIAGVYGVLLLIPSAVALIFYQRMLKRTHRYATVTGKGYKPNLTILGKAKWIGFGFIMFYFSLDLFMPFLTVIWTSMLPIIQMPSMAAFETITSSGYSNALNMLTESRVLLNTVELIFFVAIGTVASSLIFSWIVLRTRFPGRYALDTITMVPHAIPGIAFAFSVAYVGIILTPTVPLYNSLAAIILADTMRRIPFGTRTIHGSLIQIHRELEEAALISGGSRLVAIRRIIIPLIMPALFYSFVWSALHAYREVTIALFLKAPGNIVISVAIWQRWQSADSGTAAALGVIMVMGMGVILYLLVRFFPQLVGTRVRG